MDLNKAKKIVGIMSYIVFKMEGIEMPFEQGDLIFLKEQSLPDLIEANRMVVEDNNVKIVSAETSISLQMTIADRLIAGIYVAMNYEPQSMGENIEPVVSIGNRHLCLIKESNL